MENNDLNLPDNAGSYRMEEVLLKDMNPAPYNPRKQLKKTDKEYQTLLRSYQRFGYLGGIVWNRRTGNIVGGHQRIQIFRDQGLDRTMVCVVDVDIESEKAMNLMLNKSSGVWEDDMLKDLLRSLDVELIQFTGFDDEEYARKIAKAYEDTQVTNFDMDDEDILRTNQRKSYLKCGEIEFEVTTDEKKRFRTIYEQYVEDYQSDVGFMAFLLDPHGSE